MPEVLWTICAILGVLVLAYLFTRYVAGRGQGGGPSRLGKRMLTNFGPGGGGKGSKAPPGPRRAKRITFLGVTQGSITCLEKLTAEEAEAWMGGADGAAAPKMGFQEALHSVLEQRKQQRRP
mgnify:CR=1 FL=1